MIETARLTLRPWRDADKSAFHALVNTPAMTEHLGGLMSREHHDGLIDAQIALQAAHGHCMWAVIWKATGELAGVCGVRNGGFPDTPVPDELEAGWRIGEAWWGKGVAREAAEAAIAWGWANTGRERIAAWTTIGNTASWGLMERLGMRRRADLDFRHPRFGVEDPAGAMIVYARERPA